MENVLKTIIDHYGRKAQITKAIEEISELAQELAKTLNGQGDISHIVEEMADVHVMLDQLQQIFSIDDESIEAVATEKITRTLRRIKLQRMMEIKGTPKEIADLIKELQSDNINHFESDDPKHCIVPPKEAKATTE